MSINNHMTITITVLNFGSWLLELHVNYNYEVLCFVSSTDIIGLR